MAPVAGRVPMRRVARILPQAWVTSICICPEYVRYSKMHLKRQEWVCPKILVFPRGKQGNFNSRFKTRIPRSVVPSYAPAMQTRGLCKQSCFIHYETKIIWQCTGLFKFAHKGNIAKFFKHRLVKSSDVNVPNFGGGVKYIFFQ